MGKMKKNIKLLTIFLTIILIINFSQTCFTVCSSEENDKSNNLNNIMFNNFKIKILQKRIIIWQKPTTDPDEDGYPVLILMHGAVQTSLSWFIGLSQWGKRQTDFANQALEEGYIIIAPNSQKPIRPGPRAWDAFTEEIENSRDLTLIQNILEWVETMDCKIDENRIFCAGFSSGAFMTSRIGLTFPEEFCGLIIHSGCNAESIEITNRGPVFDCETPIDISTNHPPTLIVHGEQDSLVPYECAFRYYSDLIDGEIPTELLNDPEGGHIWLKDYNKDIFTWLKKTK